MTIWRRPGTVLWAQLLFRVGQAKAVDVFVVCPVFISIVECLGVSRDIRSIPIHRCLIGWNSERKFSGWGKPAAHHVQERLGLNVKSGEYRRGAGLHFIDDPWIYK